MEGVGVMVERTGWPPGLLQDDCRALSKWFAGRLGARRQIKDDLLDERLYNAIIVPDGEPNNDMV